MPASNMKVVQMILAEADGIEERCKGYRGALVDAVAEIVAAVRENRVKANNVQRRISDQCNAVGRFLSSTHGPGE